MTGCNTTITAIAALAIASSRGGSAGLPGDRAQQMADAMARLLQDGRAADHTDLLTCGFTPAQITLHGPRAKALLAQQHPDLVRQAEER